MKTTIDSKNSPLYYIAMVIGIIAIANISIYIITTLGGFIKQDFFLLKDNMLIISLILKSFIIPGFYLAIAFIWLFVLIKNTKKIIFPIIISIAYYVLYISFTLFRHVAFEAKIEFSDVRDLIICGISLIAWVLFLALYKKNGRFLFAILRGATAICSLVLGVYRFRAIVTAFDNYSELWTRVALIVDLVYQPLLAIGVLLLIGYLAFPKLYVEEKAA